MMEEKIEFKAYTFWAENKAPEIRRFGIDVNYQYSFNYLNSKLQDIFPGLNNKQYTISWKDEENDDVLISSDNELTIALEHSGFNQIVKLFIVCKNTEPKSGEFNIRVKPVPDCSSQACSSTPHVGVVCDGCDGPVVGFRYKCTSCDDFDLCSTCEASRIHPDHCMVRLPVPNLPSAVIRNATKRYRHFLKTVASAYDEQGRRQRQERSCERRRREHGHGHHGYRHHSGDGDHHRRTRNSWLDTLTNYMNEFANLAGDVNIETGNTEPKQQPQSQNEASKTESNIQAPKERANEGTKTSELPKAANVDVLPTVENIQTLLTYLGRLHTSTPSKPSTSKEPENINNQATQSEPANFDEDVEMGDGAKNSEADKESVTSEVSSIESKKEGSPEKVDDWTVINKEQDLMDTSVPKTGPPIGFNLPQEFQGRVNISQGQNLYPPLNAATAVLKPQEAERPAPDQMKPASASTAPSAPTPPQQEPKQQPNPQPRATHPLAHIDAAIHNMLAMGFTNEGGWLTQLLESKDGNIAAVLDLLTPVNPNK